MSLFADTSRVPKGPKTSTIQNGRKKLHQEFTDGSELVEEFDVITDKLVVRKWRQPSVLGGEGKWVYEIGAEVTNRAFNTDTDLIRESVTGPLFSRADSQQAFGFRIRNLPYHADTYSVTVDTASDEIVVRTTNKKYFKRIDIPDLRRKRTPLQQSELTWEHKNNTLIIEYKKPLIILQAEHQEKQERATIKSNRERPDGPECQQQ